MQLLVSSVVSHTAPTPTPTPLRRKAYRPTLPSAVPYVTLMDWCGFGFLPHDMLFVTRVRGVALRCRSTAAHLTVRCSFSGWTGVRYGRLQRLIRACPSLPYTPPQAWFDLPARRSGGSPLVIPDLGRPPYPPPHLPRTHTPPRARTWAIYWFCDSAAPALHQTCLFVLVSLPWTRGRTCGGHCAGRDTRCPHPGGLPVMVGRCPPSAHARRGLPPRCSAYYSYCSCAGQLPRTHMPRTPRVRRPLFVSPLITCHSVDSQRCHQPTLWCPPTCPFGSAVPPHALPVVVWWFRLFCLPVNVHLQCLRVDLTLFCCG